MQTPFAESDDFKEFGYCSCDQARAFLYSLRFDKSRPRYQARLR